MGTAFTLFSCLPALLLHGFKSGNIAGGAHMFDINAVVLVGAPLVSLLVFAASERMRSVLGSLSDDDGADTLPIPMTWICRVMDANLPSLFTWKFFCEWCTVVEHFFPRCGVLRTVGADKLDLSLNGLGCIEKVHNQRGS